jgi:hypothetical protein
MSNDNFEKYVDALGKENSKIFPSDEIIKITLSNEIIKKLKELKRLMEWDNNTAINAALTFFYKYGDHGAINLDADCGVINIDFVPSLKNEKRIEELKKKFGRNEVAGYAVALGVLMIHNKLMTALND